MIPPLPPGPEFPPRRRRPPGLEVNVPDLYHELDLLLQQIPVGRVTTYGALALALGHIVAARWVATYLLQEHEHRAGCACHRVVRINGDIGHYVTGDPRNKIALLYAEGVPVVDNRVDLDRFGFNDFISDAPLRALQEYQDRLVSRVRLRTPRQLPDYVGGVDLAYVSPRLAVAAYALVSVESGELVWSKKFTHAVSFPYIQSYLSFRELPVLLPLLEEVERERRLSPLIFVDGNGMLHQRHAGIATNLGVAAELSTIGVGKSLLCGSVQKSAGGMLEGQPVVYEGRVVAVALTASPRNRPIYVSPGHRIDLERAVEMVKRLFHGHRLPEPVHFAHHLSTAEARRLAALT